MAELVSGLFGRGAFNLKSVSDKRPTANLAGINEDLSLILAKQIWTDEFEIINIFYGLMPFKIQN